MVSSLSSVVYTHIFTWFSMVSKFNVNEESTVLALESHQFDAQNYLTTRFYDVKIQDRIIFHLKCFHDAFQRLPVVDCLRVLDYGTGPVVHSLISAAQKASEIVLSDYAESNLDALKKWLTKHPDAFNWSPYFDHVVQKLEGKTEQESREREERLRKVVKDVAYCDINADPPLTTDCPGPYDVVINSMCLDASCHTKEAFTEGVGKLAALLKPGGTIMSMSSERKMTSVGGYYLVGGKRLFALSVTGDYLVSVFEKQGFSDIYLKRCKVSCDTSKGYQDSDFLGFVFIAARKV